MTKRWFDPSPREAVGREGRSEAEARVGGNLAHSVANETPPPASLWRASALPSSAPSPPLRGGRDQERDSLITFTPVGGSRG